MEKKFRYIIIILFIFMLAGSLMHISAQETDNYSTTMMGNSTVPPLEVGPGLEVIQVGNVNVVVPKDSKVRKEGAQIVVEDISAYVGRKFVDMDKRFQDIEDRQVQMQQGLDQLQASVNNLTNATLRSENTE
jgi:hypothetical protein